ncbi:MAG: hypothetical protein ACRD0A_20715 [Acidimicrobiales bacterium]
MGEHQVGSTVSGGTPQATAGAPSGAAYRRPGRAKVMWRETSTAASTDSRIPANTNAFTNQVVPKSSENWTTFFVSSRRNAAPMKNWST